MPPTDIAHELQTLIASRNPLVVMESVEETRVTELVFGAAQRLQMPYFAWTITQGLRRSDGLQQPNGLTATPAKMLQRVEEITVAAVYVAHDLAVHLADPLLERVLRDLMPTLAERGSTLVLTGSPINLPPVIDSDAVRVPVTMPSQEELQAVIASVAHSQNVLVTSEAVASAARSLQGLTRNQARQAIAGALINGQLDEADAAQLMDRKVKEIAAGGLLEYFPLEGNTAELAGMDNLKAWLGRAATAMTPQASEYNLEPARGILLAGVPGCGKSLAAKQIARMWERPLLKLDAGALYDKYIGESERNLRTALEMAETLSPIVLWIDEIEKGMSVGGEGDGAATSQRMLGSFLTWMQERRADVFVVATSNDLSILPPELQRKGRFDEVFFVDLPNPIERLAIFDAQLRRRNQDPAAFALDQLGAASDGFSGAEIEQVVVAGIMRALHESAPLDTTALLTELQATVPLSRSRPDAIAAVRARAQEFVPAS